MIIEEIQRFDEAEFPARGVEVRGAEDAPGKRAEGAFGIFVVGDKALPEIFVQRAYAGFKLLVYATKLI